MKKFIESNPGLKSRFLNYVDFPDYDAREIGEIMDLMTSDMNIKLSPRAREEAVKMVEDQRSSNGKNFGNGRTARNLLDLAFENAALRVMQGKTMQELKSLPKSKLENLVSTIKLEDVKNVNLDGINAKKKGKIAFDTHDTDDLEEVVEEIQEVIEERKHGKDTFDSDTKARFTAAADKAGASNDDKPSFMRSPTEELRRTLSTGRKLV